MDFLTAIKKKIPLIVIQFPYKCKEILRKVVIIIQIINYSFHIIH
jgi:hypothetical protein